MAWDYTKSGEAESTMCLFDAPVGAISIGYFPIKPHRNNAELIFHRFQTTPQLVSISKPLSPISLVNRTLDITHYLHDNRPRCADIQAHETAAGFAEHRARAQADLRLVDKKTF